MCNMYFLFRATRENEEGDTVYSNSKHSYTFSYRLLILLSVHVSQQAKGGSRHTYSRTTYRLTKSRNGATSSKSA